MKTFLGKGDGMKRSLGIGAVLCIFFLSGMIAAQEAGGPRLEVKAMQYDFGKVVQGTQVSHVFDVRNTGTEPLIIERVQTS